MKIKIALFTLFFTFIAFTASAEEKIDQFKVEVRINPDSSLEVKESIIYDFADLLKHGIYREIPFKYSTKEGNYRLDITDIQVTDEAGNNLVFEAHNHGNYKRIKIGDPETLVTEKKQYNINYKVKGAISYFDSYDELYWNATGESWQVPILSSSINIFYPSALGAEFTPSFECYEGAYGSSSNCLSKEMVYEEGKIIGASFYASSLDPQQGLTAAISLPKGMAHEPGWLEKCFKLIKDNLIALMPAFALGVMFVLWYRKGRDPHGRGIIIVEYGPPEGLSPSEIGTLIDERVHTRDVTADIINLAVRGYLKIIRLEDKKIIGKSADYRLDKLKESEGLSNEFEKHLLQAFFKQNNSVQLSSLKEKFYKDLAEIKKKIYQSTVQKGYFSKNPNKIRTAYVGAGITIGLAGIFIGPVFGAIGAVGMLFSGLIVAIFGFFMPARTYRGVLAKEKILGLKSYLMTAEKERMKFHNAPDKSPEIFEKLLPYAIALKVEKEWARQFDGIYKEPPRWYGDKNGTINSATGFVLGLNIFNSTARSVLRSAPGSASSGGSGSGGGGFSGGGFGGGGGGSW